MEPNTPNPMHDPKILSGFALMVLTLFLGGPNLLAIFRSALNAPSETFSTPNPTISTPSKEEDDSTRIPGTGGSEKNPNTVVPRQSISSEDQSPGSSPSENQIKLSFRVEKDDSSAVEGVTVEVISQGIAVPQKTDTSGYVRFIIPSQDETRVSWRKPGCKSASQLINTKANPGQINPLTIVCNP